jgi:hypothetical protein
MSTIITDDGTELYYKDWARARSTPTCWPSCEADRRTGALAFWPSATWWRR